MRSLLKVSAMIFLAVTLLAASPAQENGGPLLSPPAKAECRFADGKKITMDYSSPRMRHRKIYGGLVPWGEVWRVGANDATTFVTNTNVTVDGKTVPAGGYTLFAIPQPAKWTLIVSKMTGEWGIPYPGQSSDFLRGNMAVSKLPAPVENLTIGFDGAGSICTMRVDWETTRASVQFSEKK